MYPYLYFMLKLDHTVIQAEIWNANSNNDEINFIASIIIQPFINKHTDLSLVMSLEAEYPFYMSYHVLERDLLYSLY